MPITPFIPKIGQGLTPRSFGDYARTGRSRTGTPLQLSGSMVYRVPKPVEGMLENRIEINSVDAAKIGIKNDDIIEVTTLIGTRIAKATVRNGIAQGVMAFPQSFGHLRSGAQM